MDGTFSWRDDDRVPRFDDDFPVAIMDAECAICTRGARLIHRLDRSGKIRICPVQSPLGAALMQHHGLEPADPSTWLFLDQGKGYRDADAIIRVGRRLGGWGYLACILSLLPRVLRNGLYRRMARRRYALFGQGDMCALPDAAFRKRLIG